MGKLHLGSVEFSGTVSTRTTHSRGSWDPLGSSGYFDGLTGSSPRINIHAVPPAIAPAPIPIAHGELRIPFLAAVGVPAARLFFFFFLSSPCDCESSRVVC